jgi:hypothetical protein
MPDLLAQAGARRKGFPRWEIIELHRNRLAAGIESCALSAIDAFGMADLLLALRPASIWMLGP